MLNRLNKLYARYIIDSVPKLELIPWDLPDATDKSQCAKRDNVYPERPIVVIYSVIFK